MYFELEQIGGFTIYSIVWDYQKIEQGMAGLNINSDINIDVLLGQGIVQIAN